MLTVLGSTSMPRRQANLPQERTLLGLRGGIGLASSPSAGLPEVTTGARGNPYRFRFGLLLAGGSPGRPWFGFAQADRW
jgi:hypothetical protein